MNKFIPDVESGTYILKFLKTDIKIANSNADYQIKKTYEFEIVFGEFAKRKITHQVYTQGQATEFEKTFENCYCSVKIYHDRAKGVDVLISSERIKPTNEIR